MTEPAAKRARTPAAIALAIMLLACALIVTALALLAQGAVAYELRDAPSAARPLVSTQTNEPAQGRGPESGVLDAATADSSAVSGSFTLGAPSSPRERALEARVAASSAGGGFVADGRIHVVVEGPVASETARQQAWKETRGVHDP